MPLKYKPSHLTHVDCSREKVFSSSSRTESSDGRNTTTTSNYSSSHHRTYEFNMHNKRTRCMTVDGLGNSSWKVKGRMDALGGRAILQENGIILAVIICERSGRHFDYKLLSPTPRYPSQKSHRVRIKDQKFYEHLTIRRTSYFSNNFVIHGLDDEKVNYVVRDFSRFGPLQLKVYEKDSNMCCGTVRQFFEHGDVSSSSWQVQANKHLSPKIMICLTAIASKSLGK